MTPTAHLSSHFEIAQQACSRHLEGWLDRPGSFDRWTLRQCTSELHCADIERIREYMLANVRTRTEKFHRKCHASLFAKKNLIYIERRLVQAILLFSTAVLSYRMWWTDQEIPYRSYFKWGLPVLLVLCVELEVERRWKVQLAHVEMRAYDERVTSEYLHLGTQISQVLVEARRESRSAF